MYICISKRKTGHILLKTTFDVNVLSALNNYRHTRSFYFSWLQSVLGFSNGLLKGFDKYPHPSIKESPRGAAIFCFSINRSQQAAR